MIDTHMLMEILGFCAGLAGWSWMIVRYVVDRMDRIVDNEHKQREEQLETMTKRHDFDWHVEHTERQLTILREEVKSSQTTLTTLIQQLGLQVNARLDNLLVAFNRRDKD